MSDPLTKHERIFKRLEEKETDLIRRYNKATDPEESEDLLGEIAELQSVMFAMTPPSSSVEPFADA